MSSPYTASPRRPFGPADLETRRAAGRGDRACGCTPNSSGGPSTGTARERDELIKQAISAQEAERRRIAFDLHDGVTTALASMSFHLSAADLTVVGAGRRRTIGSRRAMPRDARARRGRAGRRPSTWPTIAYNQTRAAISGLHSLVLDDLGLVAAIESLVQTWPAATAARRST